MKKHHYSLLEDNIYNLLQTLYKYYPVALINVPNKIYPGYQELERIGNEKFNYIIQKQQVPEPWHSFALEIKAKTQYTFGSQSTNSFPYLNGHFILKEDESLYFNIQVSLLGPYYTSFYTLHNKIVENNELISLGRIIYKDHSYLLKKELSLDIDIDAIIKKYYPNYIFFKHDFLMSFPIKDASPFTSSSDIQSRGEYSPIYDFFFNKVYRTNSIILK